MKKRLSILIVFFAFILLCLIFCFVDLKSRKYIKLNYISDYHYTKNFYHAEYNLPQDCEFTWWEHYTNYGWTDIIENYHGVKFDKNFEDKFDMSKVDIIVSFGRKLNMLYYDQKYYYDKLYNGLILAVPVFEKDYGKNKLYLYTTDKKYEIFNNEYWTNEMSKFNLEGKVRFEEE